ncbi:MAG: NAD-dependent epimerase/dehydratase family protein [Firmicutes bacterium]|nr:NAD-dependent epimerase/dehydratase family protein [Bacillota bacterium]
MKAFVTGGLGYLGRNICYALADNNIEAVVIDQIEGSDDFKLEGCKFYKADFGDMAHINEILDENPNIDIVIHNAMVSAVAKSVEHPYEFYNQNVVKSMKFFHNLKKRGIKNIIYASTASMYDIVPGFLVTEASPLKPRSPFGRSKFITEMILKDYCDAYGMKVISLRYFNPIGADYKTRHELEHKPGSNILERLIKILNYEERVFTIYGEDWETRDGTCIRDFIHVSDLANANALAALNFDKAFENAGGKYKNFLPLNIGSGMDITVREFIMAFENVTGEKIPVVIGERRKGDIPGSYANLSLAKRTIGWQPQFRVEDAIIDVLKYYEY